MHNLDLINYLNIYRLSFKIIIVLLGCVTSGSFAADMSDYTRLRKDLKEGYDPHARPVQHHSNATHVEFSLVLQGFEFDERRSLFTLYAWTVLSWFDYHMKWDPAQYGNITEINFAAHEIWQPDISVYNNYDSDIDHFQNTRVLSWNSGKLVWVPPSTFKVPEVTFWLMLCKDFIVWEGCTAKLRRWPYDNQTCTVVLGSWSHSGEELDIFLPINFSKIDTYDWVPNREWNLLSNTVVRRATYYDCCPNTPFIEIILTMNLLRRPSTHTAAVVVPALAIAVAILISFWLRPGASERLALILFVIVINSMYLYNVYLMIPNNGDDVPLVILYYRDSLLMVSVALLWTISLRYLASTKRTSPVPLPGFIQVFLDSWISKILCLDPRPNAPSSTSTDEEGAVSSDDGKLLNSSSPYHADWAWLAYLLDRFAFVIYLIVYIIFTMALL